MTGIAKPYGLGLENQKLCYYQIYEFWRERQRMGGEYGPRFKGEGPMDGSRV